MVPAAQPVFSLDEGFKRRLLERFLSYARVWTQSDESSKSHPTTERQFDLLKKLQGELLELGLQEIHLDEKGYLYASLPSNLPPGNKAPVVGLIAHVDTYPAVSGRDVKPQVVENYAGGAIALPGDASVVLSPEESPELKQCVGQTIITSDGTTLLGADDKAGVAVAVAVAEWLLAHPEVPRGKVRLGFTTDEEVGRGTEGFNVGLFSADVAYTLDGSGLGEIEDETFCADAATVVFKGADCHPGRGKDKLHSAIRAVSDLIGRLPVEFLPETTDGRQPYLHPYTLSGDVSKATLNLLVRAFTENELEEREASLREAIEATRAKFPGVRCDLEVKRSYRNMKVVLDKHPEVVSLALEAVKRAGLAPILRPIRGGTDGANLSFMGLPTPNVFAGGMNFHSLKEWISLEWMAKSAETTLHLLSLWGEREK